jgi:autotransporter-associated beta strand protein
LTLIADDNASNGRTGLFLSGDNTGFTGSMSLQKGPDVSRSIRFQNANSMGGNPATNYISWTDTGLPVALNFGAVEANLNKLNPGADCLLGIDGNFSIDLSSPTLVMSNKDTVRLCTTQNITYGVGNTITPANNTYRFGCGGGKLTLNVANKLTDDGATPRSAMFFYWGYPYTSGGGTILTAANNYTGGTTIVGIDFPNTQQLNNPVTLQHDQGFGPAGSAVTMTRSSDLSFANNPHTDTYNYTVTSGTCRFLANIAAGAPLNLNGLITINSGCALRLGPRGNAAGKGIFNMNQGGGKITGDGRLELGTTSGGTASTYNLYGNNDHGGGTWLCQGSGGSGAFWAGVGHNNAFGTGTLQWGDGAAANCAGMRALDGPKVVPNTVIIGWGSAVNIDGTNDLEFSGPVTLANATPILSITNTGLTTFSGNISGGYDLIKTGAERLRLSGSASGYTGRTVADNGMLQIGASAPDAAPGALGNNSYAVDLGRLRLADVRAATTANITLSGTQTIDGVAVVAGDRVLAKNQSTKRENGVYVAAEGAWSRALDMNATGEARYGVTVSPLEGGQAGQTWYISTRSPITLGTTNYDWTSGAPATTLSLLNSAAGVDVGHVVGVRYMGLGGTSTVGGNHTPGTSTYSGNLVLGNPSDYAGSVLARPVTLAAAVGGQVDFTGNIVDPDGLVGTGGTVTVNATGGIVRLAGGNNTYSGATSISAGRCLVDGFLAEATSTVTVDAGATLGGGGTVVRPVVVNGTLAPGASTDTFTVGYTGTPCDVIFGGGSKYLVDISGPDKDVLAIIGNLDLLSGSDTLEIAGGSVLNAGQSPYVIVTYTGSRSGEFGTVTGLPANWSADYGTAGQVRLVYSAGGLSVTDIAPTSGRMGGHFPSTPALATITGTGFAGGATVEFISAWGAQAATGVVVDSATTIYCETPPQTAGAADVKVTIPGPLSHTLPAAYTYTGWEGDIGARTTLGDEDLAAGDLAQLRRFVAGLDTAAPGAEFQRADIAPVAPNKGDGTLDATDLSQQRRYVAGLDPFTPAGGPTAFSGPGP